MATQTFEEKKTMKLFHLWWNSFQSLHILILFIRSVYSFHSSASTPSILSCSNDVVYSIRALTDFWICDNRKLLNLELEQTIYWLFIRFIVLPLPVYICRYLCWSVGCMIAKYLMVASVVQSSFCLELEAAVESLAVLMILSTEFKTTI